MLATPLLGGVRTPLLAAATQSPALALSSSRVLFRASSRAGCLRLSAGAPVPSSGPLTVGRVVTWASWAVYLAIVLFSEGGLAPGNSALHTEPETIKEALDLSLNFWLVLPALAPSLAPVVDPALEGLFNVLICWALCFWGFTVDERDNAYPGTMLPYLVGALFLTNVFFLPMLALRTPRAAEPASAAIGASELTTVQRVTESRAFALVSGVVVPLVAIWWGCEARPEMVAPGLAERWEALVSLVSTDRLAFSFAADMAVFALFQGVLVSADAARRGVDQSAASVIAAKCLPFVGLVAWLLSRPSLGKAEEA